MVRVLGPAGDIDAEMAALLAEHEIPAADFSPGALAELPAEGGGWTVPEAELASRRDLRHVRTCSIDPPAGEWGGGEPPSKYLPFQVKPKHSM